MHIHDYYKETEAKCTRLYNPQGSPKTTMVYSKLLEDGAVRPNEYKVRCEQCNDHHPVHNQDDMKIIFVTEDPELAKGTKSHSGEPRDICFKDRLLKGGIAACQTVHIEFVDVRDGGAFANNMTWIAAMISRECNCQCFIFLNVGASFLRSGGSVAELYEINKSIEGVVTDLEVKIRNTYVKLDHKFVLVPLVYNEETCSRDFLEMEKDRAIRNTPVVGQSFSKFMDYKDLVDKDVKKSYPKSCEQLLDRNSLLAVRTLKSVKTVYGREYHTVKYQFLDRNHPRNDKLMHNKNIKDYFVWLVKWVKNNYEKETHKEMILKQVPGKQITLRFTQYYNNTKKKGKGDNKK